MVTKTKNDIQKLILEVEKLVSEEGRKGISTNLTPLILNDQGQTNYRAKYARIKEWLKLNSTHNHEDRSNPQVNFFKPNLTILLNVNLGGK